MANSVIPVLVIGPIITFAHAIRSTLNPPEVNATLMPQSVRPWVFLSAADDPKHRFDRKHRFKNLQAGF
jgi:hypothetical protein